MVSMRRKDREESEAFALAVLRDCEYAVLATVNEDSTPYCIPVSPVLWENTVYFHCALEGQKLENLQNRPDVCLTCVGKTQLCPQKFTTAYESAVAYGRAQLVEDEQEKRFALRILCEKYAKDNLENAEAAISRSLARTGIVKITLARVTGQAKRLS